MGLGLPVELAAVIGQDSLDGDTEGIVERQHAVVDQIGRRDRDLRGVDLGEGQGTGALDHDLDGTSCPRPRAAPSRTCPDGAARWGQRFLGKALSSLAK